MRKLFKGGNYSRAETIRGNTVNYNFYINESLQKTVKIKVRMLFQRRFHPIVRIARAYKVRHANIGNGKDFF